MTKELVLNKKRPTWHHPTTAEYDGWLMVEGKPVAWVRLLDEGYSEGYVTICDVETRDGHQGNGYAAEILALAQEELGQPLAVTGSFTPEGFAFYQSLDGKYPVLPGYEMPTKANYRSMTFVIDWDELQGP